MLCFAVVPFAVAVPQKKGSPAMEHKCCMCSLPATWHKRTLRINPPLLFCDSCRRVEITAFGKAATSGKFTPLSEWLDKQAADEA